MIQQRRGEVRQSEGCRWCYLTRRRFLLEPVLPGSRQTVDVFSVLVEQLTNLSHQPVRSKWFLKECYSFGEHAVMNCGLFCVAGYVQHLYIRMQFLETHDQPWSAHPGHNDICHNKVDRGRKRPISLERLGSPFGFQNRVAILFECQA